MTATEQVIVPDTAEPLLGFRVWRVDELTATLWSVTRGNMPSRRMPRAQRLLAEPEDAWPAGRELVGECGLGQGHQVPAPKCMCGIYAATDVDVVAGYLRGAPLMGLVQGFGRVIPGEDGWRAEKVKIAAFFDLPYEQFTSPTSRLLLARLAERYQAPSIVPHSDRPDDYRFGVRTGFAAGWQHDHEGAT